MSATMISEKTVFEKAANAVIIYDDFGSATEANAMLERAFHRAGDMEEWNVKPWRLDLLNQPSIAAEALKDTEDAHLIVFALRPDRPYPAWLFDWLEKWAAQRRVGQAALAVFINSNSRTAATSMVPELPRFAERHGLNFIFDSRANTGGPLSTPGRDVPLIPAVQPVVNEEPPHEHWGINE